MSIIAIRTTETELKPLQLKLAIIKIINTSSNQTDSIPQKIFTFLLDKKWLNRHLEVRIRNSSLKIVDDRKDTEADMEERTIEEGKIIDINVTIAQSGRRIVQSECPRGACQALQSQVYRQNLAMTPH